MFKPLMQTRISQRTAVTAASVALFMVTSPLLAETYKLSADLSGAKEVPPTTSKGTGSLKATYDTTTKRLSWSVTYANLTGAPIAAHFHGPAPAGKNAPIEVPLTNVDKSPIEGSATLTTDQEKDLLDGNVYLNIHTQANKMGEIRGQVEQDTPG